MSRMMNQHRAKRTASATDFQTDRELDITQPNTDDVRVAAKTAGAAKGKYIALFQTPKNTLELIPTHTSVAEFINDNADHLGEDILAIVDPKGEKNPNGMPRHDVWGDKQVLKELLSDHLGTGWHWLEPKDIGQLTEAPILEAPDGRIYFHNDYHRQSGSDELLKGKTVSFDGAPENHVPATESIEEAFEEEMPKETAVKKGAWDESAAGVGKPAAKPCNDFEGHTKLNGVCHNCRHDYQDHEEGKHLREGKTSSAKVAEDPAAETAPVAPPPAPEPTSSGNPYSEWKTQNLIDTIENLTDSESFAQDKPEQKAVEQMAEVLSARPVEPEPEAVAKKSALRKAAAVLRLVRRATIEHRPGHRDSKGKLAPWCNVKDGKVLDSHATKEEAEKALRAHEYFKGAGMMPGAAFQPVDGDNAKVLEGDTTLPEGREFEEDNTGIEKPAAESARKFATINDPAENSETAKVLEGDKSVDATPAEEDHTGVEVPATELPEKVASGYEELGVKTASAPITTDKALKLIEDLTDELKALYMDAKPITTVNESRQVREAVESIYHAMKALGGAQKILAKQKTQEDEEAAAAEANKAKGTSSKKSMLSLANLKVAAAEPEIKTNKPASHVATFKDRANFRTAVAQGSKLAEDAAFELGDAIMRSASAFGVAVRASHAAGVTEEAKTAFTQKKEHLQNKITTLAMQLSCTPSYRTGEGMGRTVALKLASGETIEVPTS